MFRKSLAYKDIIFILSLSLSLSPFLFAQIIYISVDAFLPKAPISAFLCYLRLGKENTEKDEEGEEEA